MRKEWLNKSISPVLSSLCGFDDIPGAVVVHMVFPADVLAVAVVVVTLGFDFLGDQRKRKERKRKARLGCDRVMEETVDWTVCSEEEKPQNIIVKEAGCSQSGVLKHIQRKLSGRKIRTINGDNHSLEKFAVL